MLNNINLIGYLAHISDVKESRSGRKYINLLMKVPQDFLTNGERKSDLVNCIAYEPNCDFILKHFKKGDMLGVNGSLNCWITEDNSSAYKVVIKSVSFCGKAPAQPKKNGSDSVKKESEDYLLSTDGVPF